MRIAAIVFGVFIFGLDAYAQKVLTREEAETIVANPGKPKVLNLNQQGLTRGFRIFVYTPTTWIQNEAAEAKRNYQTLKIDDELIAPLIRITAFPNMPERVNSPGESVKHIVIRDKDEKLVVQPLDSTPFEESAGNAFGASVTYTGINATFPLDKVQEVRNLNPDREFIVTVIGTSGKKDFTVKKKHFGELP